MTRWQRPIRSMLGAFVVLHALAHSVLPLRGYIAYPPHSLNAAVTLVSYTLAMIALFSAGMSLLGARLLERHAVRLFGVGVLASTVALISAWDPAAWWGLALNAALVGAVTGARNTGVLAASGRVPGERVHLLSRIGEGAAYALVAYVAVATLAWPWHRHWGSEAADHLSYPGSDNIAGNVRCELVHAVDVDAPPHVVWAWLVQLGQDRAGFYSYDWLERLFLADVHNVFEIRGEWQHRAAGEFVRAAPPNYLGGVFGRDVGWKVVAVEPGRALVLEGWGGFVIRPVGANRSRLLVRSTVGGPDTPVWAAGLTFSLFELPHFIMERKMLLTIKDLSERQARAGIERATLEVGR